MTRALAAASAILSLASSLHSQERVPEWSLTPELRIGAVDGPDALDVVGSVVVSPRTGAVFVAEGSHQISAFSADGRRLRSFGRSGSGPGEFKNLLDLYWFGGFVVAIDGGGTNRVTRFGEDGELVDSRVIQSGPLPGAPRRARPVAPLGGKYFLGEMSHDVQAGRLIRTEARLMRMDGAGDDLTLDDLADRGDWVLLSNGIMFPVPMIPSSHYRVHPQGAAVAIVHQSTPASDGTGQFRVRKIGSDGKVLFARSYAYAPRPLPRGYVEDFVDSRLSSLREAGAATLAQEAERVIAGRVPRFEPPISDVRMGADGSIWLKREAHEADSVLWWVLDERGDLVGRLRLPARLKVRHIDRETVWGIESDDLDVNYVVKYRIQR